jgi:hypothetical protein
MGWSDRPSAYLRLSHAYDTEYEEAERRGWEHHSIEADHLAIYTQPSRILRKIQEILLP